MPKYVPPGTPLGLTLTLHERQLIADLTLVEDDILAAIELTPHSQKQVMLNLDQLDLLAGSVAADANHTDDKGLGDQLDHIFNKIETLLATYTDITETDGRIDAPGTPVLFDPNLRLVFGDEPPSEPFASSIVVARKPSPPSGYGFILKVTPLQRALVLANVELDDLIQEEFESGTSEDTVFLTWDQVHALHDSVGRKLAFMRGKDKPTLQRVQRNLMDVITRYDMDELEAQPPVRCEHLDHTKTFVLSVVLSDVHPEISRRIAVQDCSLIHLHEILQVAMGWENYHLYCFEIGQDRFSDPRREFDPQDDKDAGVTLLSAICKPQMTLTYEYDFGDGWLHEIEVEAVKERRADEDLPHCLDGENACPPEDVGGPPGYEEYLEALADPNHEQHEEMLKWRGNFNPHKFNLKTVNRRLRKLASFP